VVTNSGVASSDQDDKADMIDDETKRLLSKWPYDILRQRLDAVIARVTSNVDS
jgi:hypothetical protein